MSDAEVVELLEETRDKAREFLDVLEGYELKIRDIEPSRADNDDLDNSTTDVAEFIYNAKCELGQAADAIDCILQPSADQEGK